MVLEQNRSLLVWLKFSQLKPATNMQLPSCRNDLNKSGHVDAATQRPSQTEGLFTGKSQPEVTYLVAHFSFLFTLHFSPCHRPGNGQIQTSLKWRGIVALFSLPFGIQCVFLTSCFIMFAILTLRIRHILGRGCFNENNRLKLQVGFIHHKDLHGP